MPAATPTVKTRGYEILAAPYDDGNDTIGADRISISWRDTLEEPHGIVHN
jgi:hypothetical protein